MQAPSSLLTSNTGGTGTSAVPSGVTALAAQHASAPSSPHDGKENVTVGGKRKRVVLSIHEKQQVLLRLEASEHPTMIAQTYGISRQQISDIKKNRDRILAFCVDAKHVESLRRKTLKATTEYHPGVEQELYRWLVRQRLFGRLVTPDDLTNKAAEVFAQYTAGHDTTVSFKTITAWLRHFKRAHGLKTLTDDELAKLPDRFVSAMDVAQPVASNSVSHHYGPRRNNSNNSASSHLSALVSSMVTPASAPSAISSTTNSNSSMNMQLPLHLATAAPPMQLNVEDYIGGLTSVLGIHAANPQTHVPAQPQPHVQVHATEPMSSQPHDANVPPAPQRQAFDAIISTIHDINAQLTFFEREASAKLDYLDTRFEKFCFLVIPPRFA